MRNEKEKSSFFFVGIFLLARSALQGRPGLKTREQTLGVWIIKKNVGNHSRLFYSELKTSTQASTRVRVRQNSGRHSATSATTSSRFSSTAIWPGRVSREVFFFSLIRKETRFDTLSLLFAYFILNRRAHLYIANVLMPFSH